MEQLRIFLPYLGYCVTASFVKLGKGTHNILRMQFLKDMLKYNIDQLFLNFINQQLNEISSCAEQKEKLKFQ